MKPVHAALAAVILSAAASAATAERPPQKRSESDLVITGQIGKIETKTTKFGNDGEITAYTARVVIDKVEKGKDARAGDTVDVSWFRVTKTPSRPLPGAYGHKDAVISDDKARFWLMKEKNGWSVIYNSDGIETLKK